MFFDTYRLARLPPRHPVAGPSGSGKSTVIQLLERFYLPSQGQILLDNRPIEGYNVSWLRTQFGLIQQVRAAAVRRLAPWLLGGSLPSCLVPWLLGGPLLCHSCCALGLGCSSCF